MPNRDINLCDTCRDDFAICGAEKTFACDLSGGEPTDDRVVLCQGYVERPAFEPQHHLDLEVE